MSPPLLLARVCRIAKDVLATSVNAGAIPGEDELGRWLLLERPKRAVHGDYATGLALRIASRHGYEAREWAEFLARALRADSWIARAEVAGPGFVNLWLSAHAVEALVVGAERAVFAKTAVAIFDRSVRRFRENCSSVLRWASLVGITGEQIAEASLAPLIEPRDLPGRSAAVNLALALASAGTNPGSVDNWRLGGNVPVLPETGIPQAWARFDAIHRPLRPGDDQPTGLTLARLRLCQASERALAQVVAVDSSSGEPAQP